MSNLAPARLEGKVGGEHEIEHHFIFDCDAYDHIRLHHTLRPLYADLRGRKLVCTLSKE